MTDMKNLRNYVSSCYANSVNCVTDFDDPLYQYNCGKRDAFRLVLEAIFVYGGVDDA